VNWKKTVRTKIVATIGPATSTPTRLKQLLDAGVDVCRINFAHGTHDTHRAVIRTLRRLAQLRNHPLAILADISGPKIRVGQLRPDPLRIRKGECVRITAGPIVGSTEVIPITFSGLSRVVAKGDPIALDDGRLLLKVTSVSSNNIHCRVVEGGLLASHKGVNLPETRLPLSLPTDKDKRDIRFALEEAVDFLAVSFVRNAEDIHRVRTFLKRHKGDLPLIAKIEKREALDNIEPIIDAADGIMVARGDLGIETPLEDVPLAQKHIIALCNQKGKPAITATQMLESMISSFRPTRAEVSDIANAILDGTDAVMLSGETAIGNYPVAAVKMMNTIARATEASIDYSALLMTKHVARPGSVPDAISHATCLIANDLRLSAIICYSQYGSTARMVARYRPQCPIYAFSTSQQTVNRLCLTWGVMPFLAPRMTQREQTTLNPHSLVEKTAELALNYKVVRKGQRVVITAGLPLLMPGTTNLIQVVDL
jgi:pyruvate kinase